MQGAQRPKSGAESRPQEACGFSCFRCHFPHAPVWEREGPGSSAPLRLVLSGNELALRPGLPRGRHGGTSDLRSYRGSPAEGHGAAATCAGFPKGLSVQAGQRGTPFLRRIWSMQEFDMSAALLSLLALRSARAAGTPGGHRLRSGFSRRPRRVGRSAPRRIGLGSCSSPCVRRERTCAEQP